MPYQLHNTLSVHAALALAAEAHAGQKDKAGQDYILHPIHVAMSLETEEAQTVALLHDVVEDTPVTLADLRTRGFSEAVLQAVDCLTHREGETRSAYLKRIAANPLAIRVKLADLAHNSDLRRIPAPTERDIARAARYQEEMAQLRRAPLCPEDCLEDRENAN